MDTLPRATTFVPSMRRRRGSRSAILVFFLAASVFAAFLMSESSASGAYVGTVDGTMFAIGEKPATCFETEFGSFTADAVRSFTSSDISIVDGGVFRANLPGGDITEDEISELFYEDEEIFTGLISPARLKMILENGVSSIDVGEDEQIDIARSANPLFPQISGFSFKYDVSIPAGDRIRAVALEDGTELILTEDNPCLHISAPAWLFEGEGIPANGTLADAVASYIRNENSAVPGQGRITVVGYNERIIGKYIPPSMIYLLGIGFLFLAILHPSKKYRDDDVVAKKVFLWR